MSKKTLDSILRDAYYEEIKQELASLPSDEELRREFPVTEEKRNVFIKRVYRKKKPVYMIYLQRVAVFLLVFSAIAFGTMMLNPEIRADMLEKGIKLFDRYFIFDIDTSRSNDTVDFNNIKIDYIPINYNLEFEACTEGHYQSVYLSEKDLFITIDIVNDENKNGVLISDSFTDFESIVINGCNGYTSYDLNECTGVIIWGNENFSITVMGTLPIDELMKVATNIKYKK